MTKMAAVNSSLIADTQEEMMNSKPIKLYVLLAVALILILSACSTPTDEISSAPESVAAGRLAVVSATGKVVPEQEALLSVSTYGVVENLLVSKGDKVQAGQVLLRMEGSEQQAAAVSAAEFALVNAQFALDALYKETGLMAAEALRSAEIAEQALEDLYNTEQQQALAVKTVADAQKKLEAAERNLAFLTAEPTQAAIDQTYANMLLAENKLNDTLEQIEDIEWQLKKYSTSNLPAEYKRKILKKLRQAQKGLEIKRTQEQLAYIDAQNRYNDLFDPPDPVDLEVAQAEFAKAQAALAQAQRDLERVMNGPDAGDIAVLEAQIEKGYRDYEIYRTGPDPDDVALAETRVSNAEAQIAAAEETLADLELAAPFDGVISDIYINTNEWLLPGNPVMLLADLAHLQVETTDLNEIDVAQIRVGDIAEVTFDALPDLLVEGTVTYIAPKAVEGAGVNYPVIFELSELPPGLRWGMTVFVDIEVE